MDIDETPTETKHTETKHSKPKLTESEPTEIKPPVEIKKPDPKIEVKVYNILYDK